MSQMEQESGDPEAEENPEPEEDADWTARPVSEDKSDQGCPPEADEPEANSGFSSCTEEVIAKEEAEIAKKENPVDPSTSQQGRGSHHGSRVRKSHGVEGSSFEQDEEVASPESETVIHHEACSESDQQLLNPQSTENCQPSVSQESTNKCACEDGNAVEEQSLVKPSTCSASDQLFQGVQGDGSSPPSAFNGDVQVVTGPDSEAPEDEIQSATTAAHSTMDANQTPDNCNFQQDVHTTAACGASNLSKSPPEGDFVNAITSAHVESRSSMDGDKDSQTPECDRESGGAFQSFCDIPLEEKESPSYSDLSIDTRGKEKDGTVISRESVKTDNSLETLSQNPRDGVLSSASVTPGTENSSILQENVQPLLDRQGGAESPTVAASQSTSQYEQLPHADSEGESSHCIRDSAEQLQPLDSHTSSLSSSPSTSSLNRQETDNNTSSGHHKNQSSPGEPIKLEENVSSSLSENCAVIETSHIFHHSPKTKAGSTAKPLSHDLKKQFDFDLSDEDDDDDIDIIMSQLDAELLSRPSDSPRHQQSMKTQSPNSKALDRGDRVMPPNGILASDTRQLQNHNKQLLQQLKIRDAEISKLSKERDAVKGDLSLAQSERDDALKKLSTSSNHNADDIYLPQIKELEKTIAQQQEEIRFTKGKLASHDNAAKRAVTTLQNELKCRVDQVTKLYEDAVREKDGIVVKFAASESKAMENKKVIEKQEAKIKELFREKEQMNHALKIAKEHKQKALTTMEMKSNEVANTHKELEKMKEAISSSDYRIKWFQNKLKEELDAHKETKATLEKTVCKLKEAKEETEMIRKECQAIVKTYQESEEIKSNSLDKELKIKETQLKLQMQEFSDTEEIQRKTKAELESVKSQHKNTLEELKSFKSKASMLEENLTKKELLLGQLQETLNKQKRTNADFQEKITATENLEEDFTRAQEMIKNLDKDIAELKIANRDLQKDMEACRERESKMLALQSELSRTNALLRSENTNLCNKASLLTAEVEKLKMEVQELETTVKHLTDSCEEVKSKKNEEVHALKTSLGEMTKESADYKQKWEDEMDSNKTLKRRHANNVKDLTRQLQQAKRKLENVEGIKDGGSMGSRTNSNGSLNSVDNSNTHNPPAHSQPQQEFPVITEQVEVDKHVLIERIVRLQKSHARKNEKLEFLSEHIHQLLEEIKKKNKIIQSYVLREEAGTLSSEDMDANKVRKLAEAQKEMQTLLARKGGIMASLYSLHQQDGHMTLDLSLQINKKLQAVLEDTLLKNITLKENLDTLGEEIARLSQTNRKLQLHLHDLEATSAERKVMS